MESELIVTRSPRSLFVSRAPTRFDRIAYLLPVIFCTIAATGGIALTALLGARFLFVVASGFIFAALFFFLMLRRRAVRVEDGFLLLPRAFRPVRVSAAHVLSVTPMPGPNLHDVGVCVTYLKGEELVLYGLPEKDRARAAHLIREALNESLADSESVRRFPPLEGGLFMPDQV